MRIRTVVVTPFQQNCSIVTCEKSGSGVVIDPGGEMDRILAAVDEEGSRIEKIWITHGHIDHVGAAGPLAEHFGIPIEGPHRDDQPLIEGLAMQAQMFGGGEWSPFTPDRWLSHGDEVVVGELTFAVLHCPGHAPGHVIFHHALSRIAIIGDVLFQGSIGRTDLPFGDHRQLLQSITRNLWSLGNDTVFYPGHGGISTFGEERKTNPFVAD